MKIKVGDRIEVLERNCFGSEMRKGQIRTVTKIEGDDSAETRVGRGETWWIPDDTKNFCGNVRLLPRRSKRSPR